GVHRHARAHTPPQILVGRPEGPQGRQQLHGRVGLLVPVRGARYPVTASGPFDHNWMVRYIYIAKLTRFGGGSMTDPEVQDHVVLVHPDGRPRGVAPRATVHDAATPLHLGFSCYVIRDDGHVLVTRRALGKRTWPGVWTNTFCGHTRRGEPLP